MMKKRFLSFLMAACMVFALLPVTARAAGITITDIALTMTEPQVGQTLPRDARVTSPANLTVTDIKWYNGGKGEAPKTTKVELGTTYVVYITVELASGTDAKFGERYEVKPTVNGEEATLSGNPSQSVTFWTTYYFEKPVEAPAPVAAPAVENYDTFDYRAYANIYPDVKAAYGYDAQKLYAHYVNYGKDEGRVGSFISGDNPKTNAPITAPKADGRFATLLDPLPPTQVRKQPEWSQNQCTPISEMSNVRLVAEYWFTQAYLQEAREARDALPSGTIQEDGKNTWLNDTVWFGADAIKNELYARVGAIEKGYGDAYEAAMASDTTILRQFRDLLAGNFPTPPADPGVAGQKPVATVGGFSDVFENNYFADPVVWAVERNITGGTTPTTFSPGSTCTWAQILTFLWRSQGSPEPEGAVEMEGFTGTEYYYKAVLWAAEQGMIAEDFNPGEPCTRAMAVTYLWKPAGSPEAPAAFIFQKRRRIFFSERVDSSAG